MLPSQASITATGATRAIKRVATSRATRAILHAVKSSFSGNGSCINHQMSIRINWNQMWTHWANLKLNLWTNTIESSFHFLKCCWVKLQRPSKILSDQTLGDCQHHTTQNDPSSNHAGEHYALLSLASIVTSHYNLNSSSQPPSKHARCAGIKAGFQICHYQQQRIVLKMIGDASHTYYIKQMDHS